MVMSVVGIAWHQFITFLEERQSLKQWLLFANGWKDLWRKNLQDWQCDHRGKNMDKVVEKAPAKLNLGLKILGRRADGYHDILSVFQTINLHDLLVFFPIQTPQTVLVCHEPGLSVGDDNLVCRAVAVFREATGEQRGVKIALDKHIPMGAGLGGGSSDAAATLRGLNHLWQSGLSFEQLCELGAKLGSDVPFLMRSGTAVVTGRGEQVCYVPWTAKMAYVLVYPDIHISTAWAYANYKNALTETGNYIKFFNSTNSGTFCVPELLRCLENDFLPVAVQSHPEIGFIIDRLKTTGALAVSMSGSGSTLYGVFDHTDIAHAVWEAFKKDGYRTFLCAPAVID
jgi:4-diphosphocytidyl-2-C-methyl-D-erythritol kinase